jgi:hypothetical protein
MTLPNFLFLGTTEYRAVADVTPNLATHRVQGDVEALGRVRASAVNLGGAPAVWFFNEQPVTINEQWQYFIVAINPGMSLQHVSALLNDGKMVCNNGAGFGAGDPKVNYILGTGIMNTALPRFNKAWTMTNARHQMIGSVVTAFDGTKPPPIKAGAIYPSRVQDVNMDIYIYTPQNSPHLFFDCVNVAGDRYGTISQFDNGGLYPWTPERRPYSFLPFVSAVSVSYPPRVFSENSARLAAI